MAIDLVSQWMKTGSNLKLNEIIKKEEEKEIIKKREYYTALINKIKNKKHV